MLGCISNPKKKKTDKVRTKICLLSFRLSIYSICIFMYVQEHMSIQIHLLDLLQSYTPYNQQEKDFVEQIKLFISQHQNPTDRNLSVGHITTSAWIVDETRKHVLLTHHAKLNKRLQL